ncbi:MAG: VWA domain-containing protein [Treponema sp.]|nr:VWA domain-containing protein [Treponema sp.]
MKNVPKKTLIAKKKAEMTADEYFESKSFKDHLVEMFKFMTRCKKKPLITYGNFGDETAGTDGRQVLLNWNNPIQKEFPTLKLKIQSVLGLFYHEIGHILFTDFTTDNGFVQEIKTEGKLNVKVDGLLEQEKEDLEYFLEIHPEYRGYISMKYHTIKNVIEDVWMEGKLAKDFPGNVKTALVMLRTKLVDTSPILKDMVENEDFKDSNISLNLVLCYASAGVIPNPHGLVTEHTILLDNMKPYIDAGIACDDVWGRIIHSSNILLCMWQTIKDEIEEQEEQERQQQQQQQNGQQQNGSNGSSSNQQSEQSSGGNENSSSSVSQKVAEQLKEKQQQQVSNSSNLNEEAKTSQHYRGEKAEKEKSEEKSASAGSEGSEKEESNATDTEGGLPASNDIREEVSDNLENSKRFSESQGKGTAEALNQGGEVNYEEMAFSTNDGIGSKVAASLEQCAEEVVNTQLLNDSQREFVKEINDIPFTNIHKGVRFDISRHTNVNDSDIKEYNSMGDVLKYSKALQKALEESLKRKPAGIDRRHWIGKGLDKNNLYDRQKKVFYKKNIPNESSLAVSVLIDQSGSMGGRKIIEATRLSVVLEDFCRNFNIPLSITGHSWRGHCVNYDIYKDFDDIDGKDKYRLMQISSRGCNRDGAALQYCGEHLLKRPEEKKLLILISDGQPNANEYYGEAAKEDLKAIKKHLKNRGVELFAAAIDDDKEYIKAIYGNGFLDMSDLSKLPKTMVRLIESFMDI